jgi:GNAT superfamily N-acetyltransferase
VQTEPVMEDREKRLLLERFDREMRIDPPPIGGVRYEWSNDVLHAVSAGYRWIAWWSFDDSACDATVVAEVHAIRSAGIDVEWKVYGHDRPSNLTTALIGNGFVADERETLMALDLSIAHDVVEQNPPRIVELSRVADARGLEEFVSATTMGSAPDAAMLLATLPQQLFGDDVCAAAFVARVDGRPVGGGRIECPPGRSFASIWGGGTIEAFRRRGVFRALVAARVAHAKRAGYRYLLVEARESSRAILQRLGFVPLTTVVGWTLGAGST